jgi:biopolymer transport protein ExbB
VPDFLPTVTLAWMNLLSIVIKGGLVMIPLLISSVLALTVIVERLAFWRRLRSRAVARHILALVAEGDLPQAMQVASASRHPVARVLATGIASKHLSPGAAMQRPLRLS